ncbi:MAG: glycosyltransferase [Candidatus Altiarchaeota archaeon]
MDLRNIFHHKIKASVVIATRNRCEKLQECLQSLEEQSLSKNDFEIIVIDDGSKDSTKIFLEEWSGEDNKRHRYFIQKHSGVATARNKGINASKGEFICITDDDCVPDERWLEELLKGYTDEKIGGVGGKIICAPPETIVEKYSEDAGLINQQKFIDYFIVTANASYKKNVLIQVGGFDEELISHVDTDLGIRIRLAGYILAYKESAIVCHRHRSTLFGLFYQQFWYGRGHAYLSTKYQKHFGVGKALFLGARRIAYNVVILPFHILNCKFLKNTEYTIARPFLEVLRQTAYFMGTMYGFVYGPRYQGNRITEKIPFLGDL